jgi:hypothetical protein
MTDTDYREHCPEGGDQESFAEHSLRIIELYRTSNPQPTRDTESDLAQLRRAIKKLTPQTRAVILGRESLMWGTDFASYFSEAAVRNREIIKNGGSLLDRVERLIAPKYDSPYQVRGRKRLELLMGAALNFTFHKGRLSQSLKSDFVSYVGQLLEDLGDAEADAYGAVRKFLKENGLDQPVGVTQQKFRIFPPD